MECLLAEKQRPEAGEVLSCQFHGSHNGDDDDPAGAKAELRQRR
jgi:hypothetical protein